MTTLADIHPQIIQTHILPRLDGSSLSTLATASSYLQSLCDDNTLWAEISNSTWPSITHPRLHHLISSFPAAHRSFFQDSFPLLTTHVDHQNRPRSRPPHPCPSQLISAVDIRYQNHIIYSKLQYTDTHTTTDSLLPEPEFRIELSQLGSSPTIGVKVDELAGADDQTLSHLKQSVTLNWILIDPALKRAGNLSSIKPVTVRQDWVTNETLLRYVTVLPGCDPEDMVQCRIEVVLGVGKGGVGLYVKKVMLKLLDLHCRCLNEREFLVITQGALLEENNVKREVVDDGEKMRRYREFKGMKREKMVGVKREEEKRELAIKLNIIGIFFYLFISLYFFVPYL